jgi:predicted AAA+ superfamily ATPase
MDLLASFPAVTITGARATGKTTSARQQVAQTARMDQPGTANAFRADPDGALRRAQRPLLIDEWQEVPEVLAAVKRAVDARPEPGQFVLTGSVRAELGNEMWAGTGRTVRMSMYGFTERELSGSLEPARPSFVELLANGRIADLRVPASPPGLEDYIRAAHRGGYPDVAYRLTADRARRLWLGSYIDDLVTRDAASFGHGKDPGKLRAYLEALALNNAGIPTEASLYQAAGINAKTAAGYDRLLANLYVLDLVPAWPLSGNTL